MSKSPRFDGVVWFIKEGIAPSRCVGCGKVGTWLCTDCASQILFLKVQNCYRCGRLMPRGRTCDNCRRQTNLDGVVVATHFEIGPIRELIHELKYSGTVELANLLGAMLVRTILVNELADFVLVPVPLHGKRIIERGFNQAELLTRQIIERTGMETELILSRVKATLSQTKLTRVERLRNISGAFECRVALEGINILLVDDVMTTGATLEECAKTLKRAGAKRVWGVVVARC